MSDLSQVSVLAEVNDAPESIEVPRDMSVGQRLSLSRQEKSWSVQYVADQLKLSQGQILALESNKFESLPKLVIVRGFVRAYAKLLKIDADSLIALLPKESTATHLETSLRPALSTPFVDSRLSLLGHHDTNRRYIIGAVILVLLVVAFLVVQRTEFGRNFITMFQSSTKVQSTSGDLNKTSEVSSELAVANDALANTPKLGSPAASMPALQGADPVAATQSSAIAHEPISNQSEPSTTPLSAAPVEQLPTAAEVTSASKPASNTASGVVTPSLDTDVLVFKFSQNSWIQVKNESGAVLTAHLAKAGTEESFSVKQSLLVRIGNVAGVEAKLRGQPLVLTSERGSNVANLVVK